MQLFVADLFRTAISQSGSALAAYGCHEPRSTNFTQYMFDVGALFQCGGYTITDVVKCLRTVPAKDFIVNRIDVRHWYSLVVHCITGPCVELIYSVLVTLSISNSSALT